MSKQTVCVDLDGVLAQYDEWKGLDHIGHPIEGARDFLFALALHNFEVIVHTTRTNPAVNVGTHIDDLEAIVRGWLDRHGFIYSRVYAGPGKPLAVAYVDDRAVSCVPRNDGSAKDNWDIFQEAFNAVVSLSE